MPKEEAIIVVKMEKVASGDGSVVMNESDKKARFPARGQNFPLTGKEWSEEDLVGLIEKVLQTDVDLDFLLDLRTRELKILAACIRDRISQVGN